MTLYLLNILRLDRNAATILFSAYGALCYATPMLGSVLADGYIGRFKWVSNFSDG